MFLYKFISIKYVKQAHGIYDIYGSEDLWKSESGSVVSDSWDPMDYTVHGILQPRILDWITFPFSRGIFPTQGSNPGLPHCRRILYQLSRQGNNLYNVMWYIKKYIFKFYSNIREFWYLIYIKVVAMIGYRVNI